MAVRASEVRVGFHGEGAGEGELTWGQMRIWRMCRATGRTMNLVVKMPMPPGTPAQEMAALLRYIVGHHPSLRTRLRFPDGPDGKLPPRQVVAASGELPLQILDADEGEDAAEVAEELRTRYERAWFDYENEFPVRMGVVRQGGALTHLVIGYNHVVIDAAGLLALSSPLDRFDAEAGEVPGAAPGFNPLELALAQAGASGRRQSDRCIRHLAAQLERLPSGRAEGSGDPRDPRHWELVAYSPALTLGLRAVAGRTKVGTTYVLLAAYSVAVARIMGRNPNMAQIVVSNRFRPGMAEAVTQISEHGVCVVDVADSTFDEVVRRAWKTATSASMHSYFDPVERDRMLDEIAERRGAPLDIDWHLNDRRMLEFDDEGVPPGTDLKAALEDALPRTKMYWDRKLPTSDGTFFVHVDSQPDRNKPARVALDEGVPAAFLEIWADTHYFTLAEVEAFVREMESVVAQAALDPVLSTGVRRQQVDG